MLKKPLLFGGVLSLLVFISLTSIFSNPVPIIQIPFKQLVGGVILVQAKIGQHPDTLNFILDTGSGGISLDSATVARLGIRTEPSDLIIRGIAGTHKTNIVANEKLHFSHLSIDSLNFHISDYEMLSRFNGQTIHGIIGYSILKRFIVEIDYDKMLITLYPIGNFKYPRGGFVLHLSTNKIPEHTFILTDKEEFPARLLIDMGAGVCLMLSKEFAEKNFSTRPQVKLPDKLIQGVGGTISMQMTVVKKMRVGKYKFRNIPTYLFDDVFHLTAQRKLGGLVGNDFMRRFNTTLNYAAKEIYLRPNSYFQESFDYVYCGLELCAIEGVPFVCDLAKDSPADKAGLKVGDIVVCLDNDFSQNLYRYKTVLQKRTSSIAVIVQRDNQSLEFTLKPIDIRTGK